MISWLRCCDLPGVADAAEAAREALAKAHRHRTNLRNWPVTAAESAIRGARSSSALDGGAVQLDGSGVEPNDPVLAGALRVGQALEGGTTSLVGVWQRAPLQALARLHALAAADLIDEEPAGPAATGSGGRSTAGSGDPAGDRRQHRVRRRCWPPSRTVNC